MKRILGLTCTLLWIQISFGQIDLNMGLRAYYPFSGSANDASGNLLHGEVNGATLTTDRFGNPNSAYYFDGWGSHIKVEDGGALSTPVLTIAYYFQTDVLRTQVAIGKIEYTGGAGATYNSGVFYDGELRGYFGVMNENSGCINQVPSTLVYTNFSSRPSLSGSWHCLVATFKDGLQRIYLDGQLVAESTRPFNNVKYCTNTDFLIGSWWSGDRNSFQGKLDEVRVYDRILNMQEIRSLCAATEVEEQIINVYSPVLQVDVCSNSLDVEHPMRFSVGDTVLIAQMKGAVADTTNTAQFGTILDPSGAGNYEFNIITDIENSRLYLRSAITNEFNTANGAVQIVRVPSFRGNFRNEKQLTSAPWDGRSGGILAFIVEDELRLGANLDVSGKGFRGGVGMVSNSMAMECNNIDYYYNTNDRFPALKGESIAQVEAGWERGRGAYANGGGGGSGYKSGGGGGANAGGGGSGGFQYEPCTFVNNQSLGGISLSNTISGSRLFLGGGGGAGQANGSEGMNMNGGNGGGIIIVKARSIRFDNWGIFAQGSPGLSCYSNPAFICHEGNGGGGGGGSVLLDVATINDRPLLDVSGGGGANLQVPVAANEKVGPGGGGGGGLILTSLAALDITSVRFEGGVAGSVTAQTDNFGAGAGSAGELRGAQPAIQFNSDVFTPNISLLTIQSTPAGCKTIEFNALSQTSRAPIERFTWTFGAQSTSGAQNMQHVFAVGGNHHVVLQVEDRDGCIDSAETVVVLDTVLAIVNSDSTVCQGSEVTLSGRGGTYYRWISNVPVDNPQDSITSAVILSESRFGLIASNDAGCIDTAWVNYNVIQLPDVLDIPDVVHCAGSSTRIIHSNDDMFTYAWDASPEINGVNEREPVVSAVSTRYFNVSITEPVCGLAVTKSVLVTVHPVPDVRAQASNDINCQLSSASLTATGASSYLWSPAASLSHPEAAQTSVSIDTTTTFVVTGTNSFGCQANAFVTVKVENSGTATFRMPNAFTPNGDLLNDCFGIGHWGQVQLLEFSIFNRWGQRIFTTNDRTRCWDGRVNGLPADSGGYPYIIKARSFCGDIVRKGIVSLIR